MHGRDVIRPQSGEFIVLPADYFLPAIAHNFAKTIRHLDVPLIGVHNDSVFRRDMQPLPRRTVHLFRFVRGDVVGSLGRKL